MKNYVYYWGAKLVNPLTGFIFLALSIKHLYTSEKLLKTIGSEGTTERMETCNFISGVTGQTY